jgi:formylglycine-generating enzyme required for sulfatase activity
VTTPIKPKTDNFPRVLRGGTWSGTTATFVRAASRYDITPTIRYNYLGFRCAQRGARMPLTGGDL